jgi:glycerophosphoryl diester phosphodiesterase
LDLPGRKTGRFRYLQTERELEMPILERSLKSKGEIKIRTDFDILLEKKINIHSYTKARIDSGLCFYFSYLCKNQSMLKIGHRGARGYEPENTLMVSKAIDLQVDLIELDVHLSADGELWSFMTRQLTGQPTERAVNQFSVLELKQIGKGQHPHFIRSIKPH